MLIVVPRLEARTVVLYEYYSVSVNLHSAAVLFHHAGSKVH